jgi:hypothetical protein
MLVQIQPGLPLLKETLMIREGDYAGALRDYLDYMETIKDLPIDEQVSLLRDRLDRNLDLATPQRN